MSGFDNSNYGQDPQSYGDILNPGQDWDNFFNIDDNPSGEDAMNGDGLDFSAWVDENNTSLPAPIHVPNPADPFFNAAGGTFHDIDQYRFQDEQMFAASPGQIFAGEAMPDMLLGNAAQGTNRLLFTASSAQGTDAEQMPNLPSTDAVQGIAQSTLPAPLAQASNTEPTPNMPLASVNQGNESPIDFDVGLAKGARLSPTKAGEYDKAQVYPSLDPLSSQFSSSPPALPTTTAPQGQYPTPSPPKKDWPNLERMLNQWSGLPATGTDATRPNGNFQVFAAGTDSLNPVPQGEYPDALNAADRSTSVGPSSANVEEEHTRDVAPARETVNAPISNVATPAVQSVLAPMPTSNLGTTSPMEQDAENGDNATPSPVVPVKKENKPKASASKKSKKKSTSKAKQQAVKFPIDGTQLLIDSLTTARQVAIKRIPLEVVGDDLAEVVARPEHWIPKIAKAIEADYKTQSDDNDRLTVEGRREFERWQKEHENKAWALFERHPNKSRFAQACARIFYEKVTEAHTIGLEDVNKTISNGGADVKLKCSERINAAIKAIEDYSIVKYDFLRQDRHEALISSPSGFVARKQENCFVNYKKKPGSGPVKIEVDEKHSVAVKVQGKRKRKTASPAPSDEESDEEDYGDDDDDEDNDDDESDEEFKPVKRTKLAHKGK